MEVTEETGILVKVYDILPPVLGRGSPDPVKRVEQYIVTRELTRRGRCY